MAIWLSSSSSSSSMNEYANDWDLHAVVRGYSNITNAKPPDIFQSYPIHFSNEEFVIEEGEESLLFPNHQTTKNVLHELEELYKPSFSKSRQQPKETEIKQQQQQAHNSKRKKNKQKKVVCQVHADDVSSDMWAWRKYGQKPIKGSPYPRGYYKCSSSKGCLARKQVERSQTDPTMLIIIYTAEHDHPVPTHRNSLAGSTRSKFPLPPSKERVDQNLPLDSKTSSPLSTLTMTGLSPSTSLTTSMDDELVMAKGDVADENDHDDDDDDDDDDNKSMVIKDDMGYMDLEEVWRCY